MPSRARRSAGILVMSRPSKARLPALSACIPVIALKSVVLPAPLGPIRPTTSPRLTLSETSSRATSPRKRTVTALTSSWATSVHRLDACRLAPPVQQRAYRTCQSAFGLQHLGGDTERGEQQ